MAAEELVPVNVFGETKPLIQLNPNWRDDFNEYEAGLSKATDLLEYNRQMMRKLHERYFPNENPAS